jgi:hypothetical protein
MIGKLGVLNLCGSWKTEIKIFDAAQDMLKGLLLALIASPVSQHAHSTALRLFTSPASVCNPLNSLSIYIKSLGAALLQCWSEPVPTCGWLK